MRWGVFVLASLFVVLTEYHLKRTSDLPSEILWHAVLLLGILIFTMAMFNRFEQLEREIRAQAGRTRALFEASGLGIILLGPDCCVAEANGSAAMLTGWSRGELVGMKACTELIETSGTNCPGICPRDISEARPDEQALLNLNIRHRDGRTVPVMASLAPLMTTGGQTGMAVLMWDISERVRLEAEAARRRRQAEGLSAIGREIAAFSNLNRQMDRILDRARSLFDMDLVAWGVLDETARTMTWQAARGTAADRIRGTVQAMDTGVMGRWLLAGRHYVTRDLAGDHSDAPEARAMFGEPPLLTAMAVPFRIRDNAYGVLLCAANRSISLQDEDVMLFMHLSGYIATAAENSLLMDEVQHMATLEERQRLAREMHDSFGQTLTYLGMRLHFIGKAAERGDTEAILKETAGLRQVIQETHTEVRRSIFQLKESGQPRAPMPARWAQLLADFQERTGIQANFHFDEGTPSRFDEHVQSHLTRILQEALANVRNHSGAVSVAVRVEKTGGVLHLTIGDDGCGFEVGGAAGPAQHHFGLSIMRERAEAVGAALEVRSTRGQGTVVSLKLPLVSGEA
jgi:two-component system nitrate/nitrite sensor histidine kinase NarX